MKLRPVKAAVMPAFNGYEEVSDDSMEPDDFPFDVEVPFVRETNSDSPDAGFESYDAIVISRSCDMPELRTLLLCPVGQSQPAACLRQDCDRDRGLENLRKGRGIYNSIC